MGRGSSKGNSNKSGESHSKASDEPAINPVDVWRDYSLNETHPYEEIREKAIIDAKYGRDTLLCYSYICQSQQFTEEQIEELMVISSPLYDRMSGHLTEDNIKIALAILSVGYDRKKQRSIIDTILEKGLIKDADFATGLRYKEVPAGGYQDRLDWTNIDKYQNISPEFRKKYADFIRRPTTPHLKRDGVTTSKYYKSKNKAKRTRASKYD